MMVKQKLFKLLKKVDSRYTLISVIAKRARQITEDPEKTYVKPENGSKVSTAADELAADKITYNHDKNLIIS